MVRDSSPSRCIRSSAAATTRARLRPGVIYGLLVGLIYALIDRLWLGFFVEADPIHREVEGPARRTLQALGWGALGSLAGGLLYSIIMLATGVLPRVAALVGASSAETGFVVHLVISALIGMSF